MEPVGQSAEQHLVDSCAAITVTEPPIRGEAATIGVPAFPVNVFVHTCALMEAGEIDIEK